MKLLPETAAPAAAAALCNETLSPFIKRELLLGRYEVGGCECRVTHQLWAKFVSISGFYCCCIYKCAAVSNYRKRFFFLQKHIKEFIMYLLCLIVLSFRSETTAMYSSYFS